MIDNVKYISYIETMINGAENNSGAVRAIPDIYPRVCLDSGSIATTGGL